MRYRITNLSLRIIKALRLQRLFLDVPEKYVYTKDWVDQNKNIPGVQFIPLVKEKNITEKPPVVIQRPVSRRFTDYYQRKAKEGFVAVIPGAKVFGEYTNLIITPDNLLLADVSREFGAQGGKKAKDFSIFHNRLRMPRKKAVKGNVAIISTCGANNFHHWNFDVLPRLHLLQMAGLLDKIDSFIINYQGLKFQREGLDRLGIDQKRIINSLNDASFFLEAETLYIPSLTEDLGTISPWVLDFLRGIFLPNEIAMRPLPEKRLFISRRNAPSRRIINETEVMSEILRRGFVEFIPENYSMGETAVHFAEASSLVSVHGSGFSNLPFISSGAKVLDIMAPYHQDPYYWMICNQRGALYVTLFAEGEHPPDDQDLVKRKIDDDLLIDLDKLKRALDLIS